MNKLATTGLIVLLLGVVAWLILLGWIAPETRNPLTVQYPTNKGAVFHESFRIKSSGRYGVYITLLCTGPLERAVPESLNANEINGIPGDIVVKFSKADRIVFEDTARYLERAWLSNERWGYSLLRLELDEEGLYDVEVSNRSDLTYLAAWDPRFEIKMSSIAVVDGAVKDWILTSLCLAVCLLGLFLVAVGVVLKRSQARKPAKE